MLRRIIGWSRTKLRVCGDLLNSIERGRRYIVSVNTYDRLGEHLYRVVLAGASRLARIGLTAFLLIAGVGGAQAASFAIRDQSASAQGQAFAGVAAGSGGLSSMFWNPATMTKLPGWRTSAIVSLIFPYANLTPQGGTFPFFLALQPAGNMASPAALPSFYNSYQLNDRVWLGVSLNAPDGLGSNPHKPSSSQLYGLKSELRSGEGMITLAYKVNDMLSFAAGVRALYMDLYEETATAVSVAPPLSTLKGHGWDFGYILGATITPFPGTEIGIGYRSRMSPTIGGTLSFDSALPGPIPAGSYDVSLKFPVPESVNVGIRQRIGDRFTVSATYEWTHWKIMTSFPIVGSPIPGQTAPFFYDKGWMVSLGGEYQWNSRLTLRAGIGYEQSPITDAIREIRNPDTNRRWGAIGLSYVLNNQLTFDLSWAHYLPGDVTVAIVPGNPHFAAVGLPFVGTVAGHLDVVSFGLNFRWDDPTRVN
jgi:long-chain fatty acid transport protein